MSSAVFSLILITLLQGVGGVGALASAGCILPRSLQLPAGIIAGMFIHTVMVFLGDICGLGISTTTVMLAGVATAIAGNAHMAAARRVWPQMLAKPSFSLHISEVVVLGIGAYLCYLIGWAAWYWPVTPFDAMAGIDLVARQAVMEGHISNGIFTHPSLAGHLSNQPFYAPFAMLMQVITRSIGFAYGQVWLALLSFSFSWFMFAWLRRLVHPFIAACAWLMMLMTPEWFGYQYLLQTDFSNAVFFSIGCMLMCRSASEGTSAYLGGSALMFAAACWSRNETIGMVLMVLLASAWWLRSYGKQLATIAAASFATFAAWNLLFLPFGLPVHPQTTREVAGFDISRLLIVVESFFVDVVAEHALWGVLPFVFIVVVLASLVFGSRSKAAFPWLLIAQVVATIAGLFAVGTIFTAAVVDQTLRRGVFKVIPLITMAIVLAPMVQYGSQRLTAWEMRRRN